MIAWHRVQTLDSKVPVSGPSAAESVSAPASSSGVATNVWLIRRGIKEAV